MSGSMGRKRFRNIKYKIMIQEKPIQTHSRKVLKMNEFRKFIEWYALPDVYRNPRTQKEFASENNIDEGTLGDWKKLPEFKTGVEKILDNWSWDKNRNMIAAIYKSGLEGNAASQRLWAEWQMKWIPKQANINIEYADIIDEIRKTIEEGE